MIPINPFQRFLETCVPVQHRFAYPTATSVTSVVESEPPLRMYNRSGTSGTSVVPKPSQRLLPSPSFCNWYLCDASLEQTVLKAGKVDVQELDNEAARGEKPLPTD